MADATTRALAYALASIESRRLPTLDEAIAYREEKWQRHMYEAERILAEGDWLAEHDREVRRAALIEGAGAIRRRRTLAGSSGSAKDDETWDNGNMAAEAIVRSLADRVSDDVGDPRG